MPRGNDPDAQRELQERYGATTGNAESLIAANRARRNPQLRAAHLQARDEEATAELDTSKIDAPGDVVDAAVRGDFVTFVWEDQGGRYHHGVKPRDKTRSQNLPGTDDDDPETQAAKALADEDERLRRLQADADAKVEEAVVKAREEASKDAQKQAEKSDKKSD